MYVQDLLSIDMDDLGVRPFESSDFNNKTFNQSIEELFGQKKSNDFQVYSAELKINKNDIVMSEDDDDDDEYEIDPETGEKIFRETSSNPSLSLSPTNDKWIEEYLSNIESSSSNSILPLTTDQNQFLLEDPDWLDEIFHLDEISEDTRMNSTTEQTSMFNISSDDEYSTSSSNQHEFASNDQQLILIEPKSEKIDLEMPSTPGMLMRRSTQGQIDEETLQQYQIPLTVHDITESTTEEYNRHLARLSYLTPEQIHIVKDIRRRGKNKIAAQNCRKRKAVSIDTLLQEVDELKRVKHELEERKRIYQQQIVETRQQYEYLHRQTLPDRQLPPTIIVK